MLNGSRTKRRFDVNTGEDEDGRIRFVFVENSRHSAQRFASNRERRERTVFCLSEQRRAATTDRRDVEVRLQKFEERKNVFSSTEFQIVATAAERVARVRRAQFDSDGSFSNFAHSKSAQRVRRRDDHLRHSSDDQRFARQRTVKTLAVPTSHLLFRVQLEFEFRFDFSIVRQITHRALHLVVDATLHCGAGLHGFSSLGKQSSALSSDPKFVRDFEFRHDDSSTNFS